MDDLISEFITETTDSLSMLDQALVKLEQNPNDEAILGNIFRIVHTIKGTCGFLGLPRLESVAHASENVLGKIREKELEATPQAITLVLESLDCIKELIDYLSSNGQEPDGEDSDLRGRLNHFADTGQIQGSAAAPQPAASAPAAEVPLDMASFFKGDDDLNALIEEQKNKKSEHAAETVAVAPAANSAPEAEAPKVAPPQAKSDAQKPAAAAAVSGEASSIRVNLDVLENLMQMVSELVLTRNQLMQIVRTKEDRDFLAPLQHLSHITSELQEGVMKTRMQPIGNAWQKFPRLIRDLSLELNKKIELKMVGAETELDRQLLEMIKDPLTHMVRNSCDHGLEVPADRKKAGKPETGTVTLSAFHEGGHIIIKIIDDGRGLNIARIKEKIVTNKLATESELENLSNQQIMQYIFRPGFSTAEKVTAVSGRGVGMDVVKTNIEKIGGTVELDSEYGKGSEFSIKIPLTLAIVSVLIVEACGERFAIPQINVTELVRVGKETAHVVETINKAPVIRLREKLLPLVELGAVLGMHVDDVDWASRNAFVAVCRVGGSDFGVIVDRVFDTEEIVVKPVADLIKSIPLYSGNTILGDGSVIMILDPNGLARTVGEVEIGNDADAEAAALAKKAEKLVGFLLFSIGKGSPKAVPLELISRLEEIDVSTIEIAGDEPVVQYRGELMRLISLPGSDPLPTEGLVEIVVFTYDNSTVGLVVSQIVDIVHAPLDMKLHSKEKFYLGSMVIHDKTTDVVDVAQLLGVSVGNESVEAPAHAGDVVIANQGKGSEFNILLVEDSPFFRNLTVPFLTAAGYRITAADSGQEALKAIGADPNRFDLIVTDIEMPGMNGFEFTTACRALPGLLSTPIIAYTASLSEEVMKRGKSVGMNDCILKTDRPGLLQAVSRCLNEREEMAA
jgi:two-component system chemotaxis sensor kinase CheA